MTVVSSEAIRLDELILANDVDVDEGQSPELTAVTAPESVGDIEVTDEGTLFTPNAGVLAALGAGETLTETLEYTVTSGELRASSTIEIPWRGPMMLQRLPNRLPHHSWKTQARKAR